MLLNNIEFAIRMWVENESGEEIAQEVFYSLEQMNNYIKSTWKTALYEGAIATIAPVEIIDGIPEEAVTFTYEINPYMELESDEIEEYYGWFSEDIEEHQANIKNYSSDIRFTPMVDSDKFLDKSKYKHEIEYVCPHCINNVDECVCPTYPYYLIQIDKLILSSIRELNLKGYTTAACCAGHIDDMNSISIYIAFQSDYEFSSIPKGAKYSKSGYSISYNLPNDLTKDERKALQEEYLKNIFEWVQSLQKKS